MPYEIVPVCGFLSEQPLRGRGTQDGYVSEPGGGWTHG
jgi:hypothetical protein